VSRAPGKDLIFREWQLANRVAHAREQALARDCLSALEANGTVEWPALSEQDEVKRLRGVADDLFAAAMAQIADRAAGTMKS
jgi:hypothetical protein